MLPALIRGFPVSSSGSRTASGTRRAAGPSSTRWSPWWSSSCILLVGRAVLASFPTAALGAVVIYAAIRLIDIGEFRRIARFRRSELWPR